MHRWSEGRPSHRSSELGCSRVSTKHVRVGPPPFGRGALCGCRKRKGPAFPPGPSGPISGKRLELEVELRANEAELGLVVAAAGVGEDRVACDPVEAGEIATAVVLVVEVH